MEVDEALDPITTASLTGCNDSALAVPRIRFFRSKVIACDRLGHNRALDAAFIGERLERGDRHVMAVDLEEAAYSRTRVAAAVAVGSKRDVAALHPRADQIRNRT